MISIQTKITVVLSSILLVMAVLFLLNATLRTGDIPLYLDILNTFAMECDEKCAALDRLLSEENYPAYRVLVHSVKSAARIVGANAASEAAAALEAAAERWDAACLREHHTDLRTLYTDKAHCIAQALR